MEFVAKAPPISQPDAKSYSFDEKTMYRGKDIRVHDQIFIFASDHMGGQGLVAKGVVTAVEHGPGIRVRIKMKPTQAARRKLGRSELRPFCERQDEQPRTEPARKLYRQATNKIAGISDKAAEFLNTYF
jgi:hypothetical protein